MLRAAHACASIVHICPAAVPAGRRLPAGPRAGPQPMRLSFHAPFLSSFKSNRLHKRCRSPSVCGRPPKGMLCFAARGLARLSGFSKRLPAHPAPAGPPCLCFLPVSFVLRQPSCKRLHFRAFSLFFPNAMPSTQFYLRLSQIEPPVSIPRHAGEFEKGPLFLNKTLFSAVFLCGPLSLQKIAKVL